MTFSILARDPVTQVLGAAAATGSLCVGGWVLRGDTRAGLSASQGASPSTLWGEDVLAEMQSGASAADAVAKVTQADQGREWRQLTALDRAGGTGAFNGGKNSAWRGSNAGPDLIVAGNFLTGSEVLDAILAAFRTSSDPFPQRLIAALAAGEAAGGDSRGLQSAALLVLAEDAPPLTLRVDWSPRPIESLHQLLAKTQEESYHAWLPTVPTRRNPERGHD